MPGGICGGKTTGDVLGRETNLQTDRGEKAGRGKWSGQELASDRWIQVM